MSAAAWPATTLATPRPTLQARRHGGRLNIDPTRRLPLLALLVCLVAGWPARGAAATAPDAIPGCPGCAAEGALCEGYALTRIERRDGAALLRFAGPAGERVLSLRPSSDARAYRRTASFAIAYQGQGDAAALCLADGLGRRLDASDRGGLALPAPTAAAAAAPAAAAAAAAAAVAAAAPDVHAGTAGPLDRPLHVASLVLIVLVLLAFGWLVLRAAAVLRSSPRDDPWARALPWLLAAGVAARLFAPSRWVMEHMGETMLVEALAAWQGGPTPKYGPFLTTLYGGLGQFSPALETLAALHRMASCSALIFGVLLLRRLGVGHRAAALTVIAVALTPALVLDAATESMLVPAMALLAAGGFAAHLAMRPEAGERPRWALAAAVVLLLAAMWSRPEMLGLVPALLLLLGSLRGARPSGSATPSAQAWATAGLVLLAALWVRVLQLDDALALEASRGNTPEVFAGGLPARLFRLLRDGLVRKNVLLEGRVVPLALTATLGFGVVFGRGPARRVGVRFGALALLAMVPAAADLPWVSLPRVGAPAIFFAALAAGPLADALLRRGGDGGAKVAVLLALWLATGAVTLPDLLHPSPADRDRAALLDALSQARAIGIAPGRIGRRDHADPPGERVHLGFPDPMLAGRGYEPVGLREVRAGDLVWLDARCRMRSCDAAEEHPSCVALRSGGRLETIVSYQVSDPERPIPAAFERNQRPASGWHQDRDFPWCMPDGGYEIGLYRLRGERPSPTPQPAAIRAPKSAIR